MIKDLLEGLKKKHIQSISKLISLVENNNQERQEILDSVFPYTNNSFRIGITGPPGAGKSTITNLLIEKFRQHNFSVGVILVDPSSPYTGGALLGDRIRMDKYYADKDVFIRSLATRGSKGGLSDEAESVADILDAAGFDIIIFETVGVGQIEIDVVEQVDSVILILVPESGDDIQMMKAGVIEIADIFLINKSDRNGSDHLYASLENFLNLSSLEKDIKSKIIKTVGTKGIGINQIFKQLLERRDLSLKKEIINTKHKSKYIKRINDLIITKAKNKFWTEKNIDIVKRESQNKKKITPSKLFKKLSI